MALCIISYVFKLQISPSELGQLPNVGIEEVYLLWNSTGGDDG